MGTDLLEVAGERIVIDDAFKSNVQQLGARMVDDDAWHTCSVGSSRANDKSVGHLSGVECHIACHSRGDALTAR